MKNLIFFSAFLFFGLTHAQWVEKNHVLADIGLGTKSSYSLSVEYSLSNTLSLGVFYYKNDLRAIDTDPLTTITNHTVGAESNAVVITRDKFQLYVGLRLGYKNPSYNKDTFDSGQNTYKGDKTEAKSAFGAQIGLRYTISEKWALQVEYADISGEDIFQGGIALKL
jgi:opacity protein-like surface antigen